jgi:hypothetical protein
LALDYCGADEEKRLIGMHKAKSKIIINQQL